MPTESLALCLYECLYGLVAQVSVADGDCTGLPEQDGTAMSLQAGEALHRTEVTCSGCPPAKMASMIVLNSGLIRSALAMKYSAL